MDVGKGLAIKVMDTGVVGVACKEDLGTIHGVGVIVLENVMLDEVGKGAETVADEDCVEEVDGDGVFVIDGIYRK